MTADHDDDLAQLTGEQLTLALVREVRGLRRDVREERAGRKGTRRLSMLVAALAVVVVGAGGKGYIDGRTQSCAQRNTGRVDVRAAITASVDEVAEYADLTPEERVALGRRVSGRVIEELPLSDC